MKKVYIVAVLMLQGLRKKPFESGEEVVAENFSAENFDKLIAGGYIKEKPKDESVEAEETIKRLEQEAKDAADKKAAEETIASEKAEAKAGKK